jgi:hypothetical protein
MERKSGLIRMTISTSMVLVCFVAFGLAALRNANGFWASMAFSLAVITVSVALVGALTRKGKARIAWAGFAATGLVCLAVWLSTPESVGGLNGPPRMIASWLFRLLRPHINPVASGGGEPYIHYSQVSNSLEVIVLATIGSFLSRFAVVRGEE